MLDTTITVVGNLVDAPELRVTAGGASVCSFRLASTPRRFDRAENRWVDGATLFVRVSCWRQLADNVASSLTKGDRALVFGHLRQRSFETSEGERRVSFEIDAEAVGAELTWHGARSQRLARGSTPAPAPTAQPDDQAAGQPDDQAEEFTDDAVAAGDDGLVEFADLPELPLPAEMSSRHDGRDSADRHADALVG